MNRTTIEWVNRPGTTPFTWNPIRASLKGASRKARSGTFCTRISPGCKNCYASVINKRFGNGLEFTVPNLEQIEFFIDERILEEPLNRKKPATIFVGDMFDLFHEAIPTEMIAEVLRMAYKMQRHTFQFLTKRAARMRDVVNEAWRQWSVSVPPEHMWFGVSVEDNERAINRVPRLQETICGVRFLSVEPQLENINFVVDSPELGSISLLRGFEGADPPIPGIDWVICGGESGPGSRPFNLAWAESLQEQCKAAGVAFFLKQIGSNSYWFSDERLKRIGAGGDGFTRTSVKSPKGGNMAEWPEQFRVREWPSERLVSA
jgi:protein gp37